MKDIELLEYKIDMQKSEISSLKDDINRLRKDLGEFETVIRDLITHMELEFYTEKVDGWIRGHGVREASDEIKEYRKQ